MLKTAVSVIPAIARPAVRQTQLRISNDTISGFRYHTRASHHSGYRFTIAVILLTLMRYFAKLERKS